MKEPRLVHHQIAPFLRWCCGQYWVRLYLGAEDLPTGVFLRVEPDNEELLLPMPAQEGEGPWRVFECALVPNPADGLSVYAFKVLWTGEQRWLDAAGQSPRMPLRERFFRLRLDDGPPDWVPDQVFYQVFPDRFRDGDGQPHVRGGSEPRPGQGRIRDKAWGAPIDPLDPNTEFYGGDLIGVRESLDYLQDLGVTALYLNPVFASPSVHRYDTEDYGQVDPHLGGNQALADLRSATAGRGMRFVLDAVFNHTADTHPWFNRWGTHPQPGAYQSAGAPYRAIYHFADATQPETYYCWQGSKALPVVDLGHPLAQAYFYAAPDAISRRWLRPPYGADGWRLDVAHMMGEGTGARNNAAVLAALRRAIKEENPQAYVLGEHFFEATRWLQGDIEDGAMNYYGFAHPVRAFLAGQDVNYHPIHIDAAALDAWLADARSRIPYANQLCQLNLLGSHDTARFLTLVGEDRDLMAIALALLFTYPGVPCIYYGDEIGMTGANDPFNRACFDWDPDRWDQDLRGHIQRLAALRQTHPALRRGAYRTLLAVDDCFSFARFDADELLILAVNRGELTQSLDLDIGALTWRPQALNPVLGVPGVALKGEIPTLTLPPKGLAILLGHAKREDSPC